MLKAFPTSPHLIHARVPMNIEQAVKQNTSFYGLRLCITDVQKMVEPTDELEVHDFQLAKLFVTTIREFCENTSLHGFKYLVQKDRSIYDKILWYIALSIALASAVYIFLVAFDGFSSKPAFTALKSVKHPISEINFPAVAICGVNKISKRAAREYAEYLSKRTQNYTFEWLFDHVKYLGHLLDFNLEFYDEYVKFQDVLDEIDADNKTKVYDSQNVFEFKISPRCEDIMLRCQWNSAIVECMKIFSYRKTREGYCCLFNYVRQYNTLSTDGVEKPKRSTLDGPDSGLVFVLNASTSDFYFPIRNVLGFNVLIFNPDDFPDQENGGMVQLLVNPNTETSLRLDATTIESDTAVEQYTPEQRGCLFEHELAKQYAGHYSHVDCLLKCKLRKIMDLCGCAPFFLPNNFPDGTTSDVKCTLIHNKCLERYWNMVRTFWPKFAEVDEKLKFTEENVDCPDCFPICTKTSYRITSTFDTLLQSAMENSQWPLLKNLSTFKDISIGRIFFPMPTSTLYHTDVVMTWQEIVSSFGGLLGLCLGFSLISIVEIAYFATVRLFRNVPTAFTSSPTSDMQSIPKKSDHVFAQKIKRMYASDFYWLDRRKITPNRY